MVECPTCQFSEHVHTMLANFRLIGQVGIGGMSVVLLAHDLVLNRTVAIKLLNDSYCNQPERIARFENECAMMGKVQHENVVSVFSAGRARRQFYIVMELVEGTNLEELVAKNGPLEPLPAIDYTIQVAYGLAAAHAAGLLHRDMKPGNVIITPEGQAKVLDFGLAMGQQDEDTEQVIWATPNYVAPETLERKDEDARTDIYALGMTLRYLLTAKEPLNAKVSSVHELLQHKFRLPGVATELPKANEALCDLVDSMTAYAPAHRPFSYKDLLAELLAVQELLQQDAKEASPENRNKTRLSLLKHAGLTIVIGGSCALGAALLFTPEPQREYMECRQSAMPIASVELLRDVEKKLADRDYPAALNCFEKLAGKENEPTLAALSCAQAALLLDLQGNTSAAQGYCSLLGSHITRGDSASPAARDLFEQMLIVDRAVQGQEPDAQKLTQPLPRALAYLLSTRYLYLQAETEKAEKMQQKAALAVAELPPPYNYLKKECEALLLSWQSATPKSMLGCVRLAMKRHDLPQAVSMLQKLQQHPQAQSSSDEVTILLEVCEVARVLFDLLQHKIPGADIRGESPDAVAALAAQVNARGLETEARCLCLLLSGDYTQAFDEFERQKSVLRRNEPFVVMMEDWKKRLLR